MIEIKRDSIVESVAETIAHKDITLDAKYGPWFLVEVELDPNPPTRPASGSIAYNAIAVSVSKSQPSSCNLSQTGVVTTAKQQRAIGDQMLFLGPERWRGVEELTKEGDYYHAHVSVNSSTQATPAVGGGHYRLKFATADELAEL